MLDTRVCETREHDVKLWGAGSTLPDRVVVINDLSEPRGGATSIALASMRLLTERGVPVTLITGDDGASVDNGVCPTDFIAIGGTHILEAPMPTAVVNGLYNRQAERTVSRWIKSNDTPRTVYHLHGWSKILSPSIFRALRVVASRLVISAHDFFVVCPNGGYFNFRLGQPCTVRPMGIRCLLSSCDRRNYAHKLWRWGRHSIKRALFDLGDSVAAVVAVHDGMIVHLENGGVPRQRLRTLRNPVTPWRAARVHADSNHIFAFVGRLDHDKGVDLLARAAQQAGVRLRIIGDGPLANWLAREHPETERFSWKPPNEISDLIADVRMLVVPSRTRETFSLVAFEALTSGVPVVISKYAMVANQIASSGLGIRVDPYDERGFAALLAKLGLDDASVGAMSLGAHRDARDLAPTPEQWIENLLAIYADVLQPSMNRLDRPLLAKDIAAAASAG
jgi:glycosyltransferase involved in cell wall biosynthesis